MSRPDSRTAPSTFLVVLATFTGNLFLVVGSLLFGVMAMLVSWVPPRGNWMFGIARLWSRCLLAASGVRVEVQYAAELQDQASYVFLSNHQSLFDIPALLASCPGQVRFMAKRSLFLIPIFGWAMAAGGFIPIDRNNRSTARQSFAAAIARLRHGVSVVLFPEGTRSLSDELLPFQRGGFLLALKTGLPIVPVGIEGSRRVQHRGNWAIRPNRVVIRYGAPIRPADYGLRRKGELTAEVRRQVASLAGLELPAQETAETAEKAKDCKDSRDSKD
ncbi:MAG TPA: lysophospholipid acyltransferase family protein [Thermoanaerobaculia bacterium]|nr:lysophospholipid acyltransferase family protein [Thermoanaerobaculia bacterium]